MHLTNASINKNVPDAEEDAPAVATMAGGDCKQLMSTVWTILKERGVNTTRLWERICRILTATVAILVTKVPNVPEVASGFELFGFDVRTRALVSLPDVDNPSGVTGLRVPPLAHGGQLLARPQHGRACRYPSQSSVTKGHFSHGFFAHACIEDSRSVRGYVS